MNSVPPLLSFQLMMISGFHALVYWGMALLLARLFLPLRHSVIVGPR